MRIKNLVILLVVLMLLVTQVTPAFAACKLMVKYYLGEQCNPNNWCWWYDGQTETFYDNGYDCTGDGYIDTWVVTMEEGPCCNLYPDPTGLSLLSAGDWGMMR